MFLSRRWCTLCLPFVWRHVELASALRIAKFFDMLVKPQDQLFAPYPLFIRHISFHCIGLLFRPEEKITEPNFGRAENNSLAQDSDGELSSDGSDDRSARSGDTEENHDDFGESIYESSLPTRQECLARLLQTCLYLESIPDDLLQPLTCGLFRLLFNGGEALSDIPSTKPFLVLSRLQELALVFNPEDETLGANDLCLLRLCTNLRRLKLGSTALSNECFNLLVQAMPHLMHLTISSYHAFAFTHTAVYNVADKCKDLRVLDMTEELNTHFNWTDNSVAYLIDKCPQLTILRMRHANHLTPHVFASLLKALYLEELDITGCMQLSESLYPRYVNQVLLQAYGFPTVRRIIGPEPATAHLPNLVAENNYAFTRILWPL